MTSVILVGPTRTATTSVFRYFLQHPRVSCSERKEADFFLPAAWGQSPGPITEYDRLFPGKPVPEDGMIRLEASPLYFAAGSQLASALVDNLHDVKVIVHLREPTDRFVSLYHHVALKRDTAFDLSLAQFFEACVNFSPDQVTGYDDLTWLGLREGCYGELLEEWLQVIPAQNLHLVDFDVLQQDPETEMSRLCQFLQVEPLPPGSLQAYNQTRFVHSAWLHRLAMGANAVLEPILNAAPESLRVSLRAAYYRLNGETEKGDSVSPELKRVQDYYVEDRIRLRRLLEETGRGLPGWLSECS